MKKELIVRGDLQRCLVVCPGSLAEQWQDELYRRFQLPFEIMTNDKLEAARTGNWFLENDLVIARLDKLSRNLDAAGNARHLHYAPYLDYRPLRPDEPDMDRLLSCPECAWVTRDLEQKATVHAIAHVVPEHLVESRDLRTGRLRFLEVKGRASGAATITVTKNEILILPQQARGLHSCHCRVPAK